MHIGNYQSELARHLSRAKFKHFMTAHSIVGSAIREILLRRKGALANAPLDDLHSPCLARASASVGRPDETLMRHLLFAALFRAWMIERQAYPKINAKDYPSSAFMIFAEPILASLGIGKPVPNGEAFRSYRKSQFEGSGFTVVRGGVN